MIVTINTKEDGEIGEVVYWFERRRSHDHK